MEVIGLRGKTGSGGVLFAWVHPAASRWAVWRIQIDGVLVEWIRYASWGLKAERVTPGPCAEFASVQRST